MSYGDIFGGWQTSHYVETDKQDVCIPGFEREKIIPNSKEKNTDMPSLPQPIFEEFEYGST